MSSNEKKALFKWYWELNRAGFPLQHSAVRKLVTRIQRGRVALITTGSEEPVSYPPVGLHWVKDFLERQLLLKSGFSQQIDLFKWVNLTRKVL